MVCRLARGEDLCGEGSRTDREAYSIVIPPPNVTGVLTIGHVLNATIQDILIRRARLEGKSALWLPGTDHASIATQAVVERELRKSGASKQTRYDYGRDKIRREGLATWREEKGGIILEQLRQSRLRRADWDRDDLHDGSGLLRSACCRCSSNCSSAGELIYRGKRMVNWGVRPRSPLSRTRK